MPENRTGRSVYIDILRVAACFLVIVNHTNSRIFLSAEPSLIWFVSLTWFYISKTAVPLFLILSGAVLLPKNDSYKKTLQRVLRIVLVIILFSALYFVWQYLAGQRVFDISQYFQDTYKNGITNAYWYLYLYAGILLMMPILQKLARTLKKTDYHYIFFWSIIFAGVMPILIHYIPALQYNSSFILPLFSTYIGLLFAGFYLHEKTENSRRSSVPAAVGLAACTAVSVLLTFLEYRRMPESYLFFDNRLLVTITLASICLFWLVKCLCSGRDNTRAGRVWTFLGRCTFGIYLLSDMFIDMLEPVYNAMSAAVTPFPAMLIYEVLVFACGLAVTVVLTKIPFVNKLI